MFCPQGTASADESVAFLCGILSAGSPKEIDIKQLGGLSLPSVVDARLFAASLKQTREMKQLAPGSVLM